MKKTIAIVGLLFFSGMLLSGCSNPTNDGLSETKPKAGGFAENLNNGHDETNEEPQLPEKVQEKLNEIANNEHVEQAINDIKGVMTKENADKIVDKAKELTDKEHVDQLVNKANEIKNSEGTQEVKETSKNILGKLSDKVTDLYKKFTTVKEDETDPSK